MRMVILINFMIMSNGVIVVLALVKWSGPISFHIVIDELIKLADAFYAIFQIYQLSIISYLYVLKPKLRYTS